MASRIPTRAQAIFDRHYEFHARYGGDEHPKKSAAEAKRISTSLRKALSQFSALLEPEQLKALESASNIMAGLGSDLDVVCRLARNHRTATLAKDLSDWESLTDAVAQERWGGNDEAMIAEARDLVAFVDDRNALEVEEWILSRNPGCKYAHFPDRVSGRRYLGSVLKTTPIVVLDVRRHAADYVHDLRDAQRRQRRFQDMYYVGLDDFEAWRAWRMAIAASIVPSRNPSR